MNRIEFKEGGFPLHTDTLKYLQDAYSETIEALTALGGDNYILTGCEVTGSAVSKGVVVINEELLPFKGGTKQANVLVRENTNKVSYEDGDEKDAYFTRWAEFGTGTSQIAWSSLKNVKNLQEIDADFTSKLNNLIAIVDTKSVKGHTHSWSQTTGKPSTFPPNTHSHSWSQTTGKPSTFPPSSHGHTWSKISGKPSTFPPNSHTHSSEIPKGLICMWSGSSTPSGWALCNGSNGTPDLRNRFIVGSGGEYPTKNTGGAKSVTLTENQMPSHRHTANSNSTGSHKHSISGGYHTHSYNDLYYVESGWDDKRSNTSYGTESMTTALGSGDSDYNNGTGYTKKKNTAYTTPSYTIATAGNHSHTISINSRGGSQSHENRPPYYALAFIMKL